MNDLGDRVYFSFFTFHISHKPHFEGEGNCQNYTQHITIKKQNAYGCDVDEMRANF